MTTSNPNHPNHSASDVVSAKLGPSVSPLRARYQHAGFVSFGALGLAVAVRHVLGNSASLTFVLVTGAVVSAVVCVRASRRHGKPIDDGDDTDGGLYIGFLLGSLVAAALLVAGRPDDWVLSGLLIAVVVFMVAMARLEASTLGLTAALSLATVAAFVGAVQFSIWVSWTLFALSTMLVAAGFAISTTADHH